MLPCLIVAPCVTAMVTLSRWHCEIWRREQAARLEGAYGMTGYRNLFQFRFWTKKFGGSGRKLVSWLVLGRGRGEMGRTEGMALFVVAAVSALLTSFVAAQSGGILHYYNLVHIFTVWNLTTVPTLNVGIGVEMRVPFFLHFTSLHSCLFVVVLGTSAVSIPQCTCLSL